MPLPQARRRLLAEAVAFRAGRAPIDRAVYLPVSWIEDPTRRTLVDVPAVARSDRVNTSSRPDTPLWSAG